MEWIKGNFTIEPIGQNLISEIQLNNKDNNLNKEIRMEE